MLNNNDVICWTGYEEDVEAFLQDVNAAISIAKVHKEPYSLKLSDGTYAHSDPCMPFLQLTVIERFVTKEPVLCMLAQLAMYRNMTVCYANDHRLIVKYIHSVEAAGPWLMKAADFKRVDDNNYTVTIADGFTPFWELSHLFKEQRSPRLQIIRRDQALHKVNMSYTTQFHPNTRLLCKAMSGNAIHHLPDVVSGWEGYAATVYDGQFRVQLYTVTTPIESVRRAPRDPLAHRATVYQYPRGVAAGKQEQELL